MFFPTINSAVELGGKCLWRLNALFWMIRQYVSLNSGFMAKQTGRIAKNWCFFRLVRLLILRDAGILMAVHRIYVRRRA